ncbi:MAG TPA: hypothetical protein PK474_06905 [Agitococcus sp.]|nr:hypothetical protein [Agitococcus sp.]HNG47555.1 hypothetical protein [Agitococcus sp.]
MLSIAHPIIRFPLILMAAAFAIWATQTGIAGLYQFQAQSHFETWQNLRLSKPNYTVSPEEYQDISEKYRQSIKLTPYNADFYTAFADMQLWYLANTPNIPIEEQKNIKANILSHYRTALAQRPTWPYSHIYFAVIKARFGDIDNEFIQSLHTANKLGKNEVDVIRITVELGLALWSQLDQNTHKLIANAIERSISWNLNEQINNKERIFALSLVGMYQKQKEICALMSIENQKKSNMCD